TQQVCGTAGSYCCADQSCGGNGCCTANRCVASGTLCPAGGTCNMGACGACGGDGKPCCATPSFCTARGFTCSLADSKCHPCGGKDQPCCDGNRCDADGCCDAARGRCVTGGVLCADGSKCLLGGCSSGACGGLGQSMCASGIGCTAPFT